MRWLKLLKKYSQKNWKTRVSKYCHGDLALTDEVLKLFFPRDSSVKGTFVFHDLRMFCMSHMFNLMSTSIQPLQCSSGSVLCLSSEFDPHRSPTSSWGLPEQKLYCRHLLLHLRVSALCHVLMAPASYHHLGTLPFPPGKSVDEPGGLIL